MPRIYNADGTFEDVEHINWYLLAGPDIYAESRSTPICPVPKIITGNRPADGGNLLLSEAERDELLKNFPQAEKFVRQIMGGEEFINNKKRFCLWLVDATPEEIRNNKFIYERVKKCREDRLKGAPDRKKLAETPHLFRETRNPKSYILIPETSSERRKYIPIGFLDENVIPLNSTHIIPDAEVWHFGILTSSVHMIWTKTVCGRLESRYRYSAKIVYNNFVWAQMTEKDLAALKNSAQKILDVRKNYPNASLADLYDEITMPKDLRAAHRANDKIVMKIYGYDESMTEEEIAVDLLERYDALRNSAQ